MRGASVVRRRSGTNPAETAGTAGAVNGGHVDGGGSGLLAGGNGANDGMGASAAGHFATVQGNAGGRLAPSVPETSQGPQVPQATQGQQGQQAPPSAGMVQATHPHPK